MIAVILSAVIRIGGKTLRSPSLWALAAFSFVAIFFFNISFVLIIFAAALLGWIGHRVLPSQFPAGKSHGVNGDEESAGFLILSKVPRGTWKRTFAITSTCVFLWSLPIIALGLWLGWDSTPVDQGVFFSKAALVTFGGAYAVLPYVAQQAVENFQWLSHPQMMSGLALAETTPGPLVIVLQFVGFVGGWQNSGAFSPLGGATIGAFITTWATFVPCFLFVFLGAPYVERLRDFPRIGASLTAITAAVVGVILNLGVDFSIHAIWPEPSGNFDIFVAVVALGAFIALWKYKIAFTTVLAACAILGLMQGIVLEV